MEFALLGNHVGAARMSELGLVNRLVDDGDALGAALGLAREIAANGPRAHREQADHRGIGGLDGRRSLDRAGQDRAAGGAVRGRPRGCHGVRREAAAGMEGAMMSDVLLLDRADGVATVTLNRPEVRNALSSVLINALRETMRALEDDAEVHAVVLTGADPAFCVGLDLKQLGSSGTTSSSARRRTRGPRPIPGRCCPSR